MFYYRIAIMAERAYYFWRLKLDYERFSEKLFSFTRNKIKEAFIFRASTNPIVRIAFLYLKI